MRLGFLFAPRPTLCLFPPTMVHFQRGCCPIVKAGLGLWHVDGQSFLLGSCSPFEAGCSQAYPDPGQRLGGNTQQTCSLHGAQWRLGQAPIDGTAPRVSRIVSFRKSLPVRI